MTTSRRKLFILKTFLRSVLFASAVFLFVLHVYGVFDLFSNGRTNFSIKKVNFEKLELPAVTLCSSQSFDWDALTSYNLSTGLRIMNENNNMGNKTVFDIFEEVSMVINKDFSLNIPYFYGGTGGNLVEGRNVLNDTIIGEFYINVYKMYSMYSGICYTITSNYSQISEAYFQIIIKLNESISESKIPSSINGILSTPDERYGSVLGIWSGSSPFSFTLTLNKETKLLIMKQVTNKLVSESCSHYKNTAYATCFGKRFITQHINLSQDCERPCKLAAMQNLYELLPNNTFPKCVTVKDHNCMWKHSWVLTNHTCKSTCSLTTYKGKTVETDSGSSDKSTVIGITFTSTSVEVHDEYLIYDIYTFVGSVGGYMGLFIGFSFFDFGSITVNYLIGKCFNRAEENIC
jgi:hypothetical protein